ncbi:LEM3 family/CDC50 family protein [Colletotrichum musicola]|uniref:LEM3 family/CDC50 family protein n=2 Tax=Colletotrichum orchidearum species complex TaxID=2707337 RepID=A0A8H6NTI4_9PEZI|nr:LEM3 family/CDC50 family protein [Colletotrichum plurivorum]KAF6842287.1 LEM3 family/CDC50 family protein [Colletotrichum musicola]
MPEPSPGVNHADSIDSQHDTGKKDEKKKSRRPANTAFRQQRLKAWQPILTPKTVLPLFFIIGIIFAPIGGLLLYASAKVQEIRIEYTNCNEANETLSQMPSKYITTAFKTSDQTKNAQWAASTVDVKTPNGAITYQATQCRIQFRIPEDMGPPVLFYYHLTNFYQNHRRYVASFSDKQLKGDALSLSAVKSSSCEPLESGFVDGVEKPYYPCGLIANSMFNDTFSKPRLLQDDTLYEMTDRNVAWASDSSLYGKTKYAPSDVLPPPNWRVQYPNYTEENPPPDLETWPAFQVWMRTAGLPTFSKLYQRNDTQPMKEGTYEVNITYNFPTQEYKGTKSIILSTRTIMGGKNPFLGIAYIVVGGICILLGAIFTVTHLIRPRKLGDHTYLSWNNAPGSKQAGPSTAMASGRDTRHGEA